MQEYNLGAHERIVVGHGVQVMLHPFNLAVFPIQRGMC